MANSTILPMDVPLLALTTDKENYLIGCIYIFAAFPILPIYALINTVIILNKDLHTGILNHLMLQINFADCFQAFLHLIGGVLTLLPNISKAFPTTTGIIGSALNSSWFCMFPIMSTLSISRIFYIYKKLHLQSVRNFIKILNISGWSYILIVFVWMAVNSNFVFVDYNWTYDTTAPGAAFMMSIDFCFSTPLLIVSYVAYLVIVAQILATRRLSATVQLHRREYKIFTQYTLLSAYILMLILVWNNSEKWLPQTKYVGALVNVSWILFSYLNPLLLMSLNSALRKKVIAVVFRRESNYVASILSYQSK